MLLFRSADRPNTRFPPARPINGASLWKWRSEGGMMERLPQRFACPRSLETRKGRGFPHIPTATATAASKSDKLPNPRQSNVIPDSCAEP
jgi:hypothetical protein